MSAIAGGVGIGAGVGVSSVALAPFNAANTFMGSAFFGYGMILGERYMYQSDWPKIQQRLENGEKIENIIQEYTGTFTAVVMKEAKIIFDTVTREFIEIMKAALTPQGTLADDISKTITSEIEHGLHGHIVGHPKVKPTPVTSPVTNPTIGSFQPSPITSEAPKITPKQIVPLSVQTNVKSWTRDITSLTVQIDKLLHNAWSKGAAFVKEFKATNKLYHQKVALRLLMVTQLNKQIAIYGIALNPYLS